MVEQVVAMKHRKLVVSGQWPVASEKPQAAFPHGFQSPRLLVSKSYVPRRSAFTLVEVLALVAVILILAATAVPRFSSPDTRAKDTALNFNLNTIRSQIATYKNQHGGIAPQLSQFAAQMTRPTSPKGLLEGRNLTCGPYFQGQIPANPFNGSNILAAVAKPGWAPKAAVPGRAGWLYDETTGALYPNNPEYYATPH